MMKKIELLAPAGNLNKLDTALHFGADAVYIGGKEFSLRSYAGNFDYDEITLAVDRCKKYNKKLYVAVNIFAKNDDFDKAAKYFTFLNNLKIDAIIINDAGLISYSKKYAPKIDLHLSTQANTLNKHTVKFWAENGIKRIVLARELSLFEIKEIKEYNPKTEIEVFVHGAMCISYSGRCLLSNYLSDRDSNRGECVQACRWNYEVREKDKYGNYLNISQDERGSYIFNSKDLNMLPYLAELANIGVDSFKIEGRMKSEYYLATVINAYRRALDNFYKNGDKNVDSNLLQELFKTAHREYTTAYYLGKNDRTVNYNNSHSVGQYTFIGIVLEDSNGQFSLIEMRNRFKVGDVLEVLSPDEHFNKSFEVTQIKNIEGECIDDVKLVQQLVKLKTPYSLKKGAILRKKNS